jgi:hypothetical protein
MSLRSQLFRGDPKLDVGLVSDPAHIERGAVGEHVGKIQRALITLRVFCSAERASRAGKNIAHGMKRHIFSDGERARWRVVEGDKKNAS